MEKNIIVAVAENGAIGRNNALLWHIPADLKYFKETTSGYPVIMGRKTFESIGRALPHRTNIVVSASLAATQTNNGSHSSEHAGGPAVPNPSGDTALLYASSLDEAFRLAENTGTGKCFIIGGGSIYAQSMPLADRLYITHVHTEVENADTFFAPIDPSVWTEIHRSETFTDPASGLTFEFVIYSKN